jgi:drug/metabolite transporter (DMT)-like permease
VIDNEGEHPSMHDSNHRGYFLAITSAFFLSWTSIFIRYLVINFEIPALVLAFWRNFFVVVVVAGGLLIFNRKGLSIPKTQLRFFLWFGAMLALFNSFWTTSVALTGAAVATVLVYSSGAFTAVLDALINKEPIGWIKGLAVVLCLGGCVLVSGALDADIWAVNALGIVAGILSGFMYAVYTLMGRSAAQQKINIWTTLLYTFFIAGIFLLVLNVLPLGFVPGSAQRPADMLWLGGAWRGWLAMFLLSAGPTVMGFGSYNRALQHLPSSIVNLIVTSEPVFTTVIAFVLLGEQMSAIQLVGSALILTGVVLVRLNLRRGLRVPAHV